MIYRILADDLKTDDEVSDDPESWPYRASGTNLGGVSRADADWQDLTAPRFKNPKARFYFTEEGWNRYGRRVYQSALLNGHQLKVIRRKNPDSSQIVYRDRWQVAILPRRRRTALAPPESVRRRHAEPSPRD